MYVCFTLLCIVASNLFLISDTLFYCDVKVCRDFLSMAMECVRSQMSSKLYLALCDQNMYGFEGKHAVKCSFYNELLQKCARTSIIWYTWRTVTNCNRKYCKKHNKQVRPIDNKHIFEVSLLVKVVINVYLLICLFVCLCECS